MPTETNKKLALIGYGKMGRLIEQLSPQFGFDELGLPAALSAASIARSAPIGSGGAVDPALVAALYDTLPSMPAADRHPT